MASNYIPNFDPNTVTMQDAKRGEIPKHISEDIITDVKHGSALMKLARAIPMRKPIEEFTYMTGVGAFWVNEAERIQTDKPTFVQAEMRAHKMGVIIPTTKENLRYSVTNFFELMRAEIAEAFYKKFDQAGFAGINSPWKQSVLSSAEGSEHLITETTDKYEDFNQAIGLIEAEDYEPNGIATIRKQRMKYRSTKDNNGMPIFNTANSNNVDDILGLPIAYAPKTSFGGKVMEVLGDWNYAFYGVLQGIEFDILTEATLTTVKDAEGNPLALAERDMAAIKATFSIGWMIGNEKVFAAIKPASSETRSATKK